MSTATAIRVERQGDEGQPVEVRSASDGDSRYDQLLELTVRLGRWLSSPEAKLLRQQDWDLQFARYHTHLEALRRLGDELRPVSLRPRHEPLSGDALIGEVLELFAA